MPAVGCPNSGLVHFCSTLIWHVRRMERTRAAKHWQHLLHQRSPASAGQQHHILQAPGHAGRHHHQLHCHLRTGPPSDILHWQGGSSSTVGLAVFGSWYVSCLHTHCVISCSTTVLLALHHPQHTPCQNPRPSKQSCSCKHPDSSGRTAPGPPTATATLFSSEQLPAPPPTALSNTGCQCHFVHAACNAQLTLGRWDYT